MRKYPYINFGPLKRDFLLGKIQNQGQSAGNIALQSKGDGSSETTRETFILNNNFKFWFIGFTEGVGSFSVNKDGLLEFKITLPSVNANILFYIKKELGFGIVRVQDKKNKTHCFKVNNKEGLLKIISIFNGNLYLESRKEQFKLWLIAVNKFYLVAPLHKEISYIENLSKPSLDNSWLSGFTETTGCFTCSIIDKPNKDSLVKLNFSLVPFVKPLARIFPRKLLQKGASNAYFETMNHLAEILGGKTHFIEKYNGYCTSINTTKLSKTIRYFKTYPLKTKKSIIYFNWYKIYKLVSVKKHLTNNELNNVKTYINNLNRLYKQI